MSELVIAERSDIVAIADAVRSKTETTNEMTIDEIVTGINSIEVGVKLPELSSPASESEIFNGYEVIDETGAKITGTFSIDNELNAQDNLIAQIQSALEGKSSGGSSEENSQTYTIVNDTECDMVVGSSIIYHGSSLEFPYVYHEAFEDAFPLSFVIQTEYEQNFNVKVNDVFCNYNLYETSFISYVGTVVSCYCVSEFRAGSIITICE